MKLGRRKRKARALASRRSRAVELVGRVGAVAEGQVFVDELWDVRDVSRWNTNGKDEDDEVTAIVEDAVLSIAGHLGGGVAPRVGPLGDSMGADLVRVWGERSKDGQSIKILRAKTCPNGKPTRSGRRKLRELARQIKRELKARP